MTNTTCTEVDTDPDTDQPQSSDLQRRRSTLLVAACTLSPSQSLDGGRNTEPEVAGASAPSGTSSDVQSPSTFHLTPKRKKAIEAVRFIAAHLKNEDDFAEVGNSVGNSDAFR